MDRRKDPIQMPFNKKFRHHGLLSCPFCGGQPEVTYGCDGSTLAIYCSECGCRTRDIHMPESFAGLWKEMWWEMRARAVKFWNKRK